MNYELIPR